MSDLDATPAPTGASGPSPANGHAEPLAATAFDRPSAFAGPPTGPTHTRPPTTAAAVSAPQLTHRGRLRKWDRPKPPMDWRWWVGNLGKTLIATGLLMFGFVAYQLWGTGIETARAQNELESEFDALLADAPPVVAQPADSIDASSTDPAAPPVDPEADPDTAGDVADEPSADAAPEPDQATPTATAPPVPVDQQNIPALDNGDALARLEIPRIGRNDIVVAGVDTGDLKKGPGHFPDTPLPGQLGNAAIAGHRTTYGSPFFNVDDLQIGDPIIATTLNGTYTYQVTGIEVVSSSRYDVVATADPDQATLTLISCHPKYTARERIVVFSELIASESSAVGEPVRNYGRPIEADTDADSDSEAAAELPGESEGSDTADLEDAGAQETPAADDPNVGGTDDGVTGSPDDVEIIDDPGTLEAGQVSEEVVDAFSDGWFSDPSANGQVGLWGALLALVGLGAYFISRQLRRDWAGALIGLMPFVITLYFFFQNVNRLLPPNL